MLLMPFAGFTPLSVFSLVTCQLYCKAKHHWEDTAYKTSPMWGTPLFSKSCQDLTPWQIQKLQHHWELLIYTCRLHWGKWAEGMCWGWTVTWVQSYLSAFSEHLYAGTNLQRQWDLKMRWFASCSWTTNPASQPNIYIVLCFLKKKSCTYLTILNTSAQSPSISLREKQSLTAQLCTAFLSWKINLHIQVYPPLGGKILSPSTSRQSFNSKMKIPDTNHTACTWSKWSITQNMAQQISHVLCFTWVDLYSIKQSQVLSHE